MLDANGGWLLKKNRFTDFSAKLALTDCRMQTGCPADLFSEELYTVGSMVESNPTLSRLITVGKPLLNCIVVVNPWPWVNLHLSMRS